MALNNLGLGFVFTAQNLASGTINRLQRQVNGLGTRTRLSGLAMRGGFAVAAAGAATLAVGVVGLVAAVTSGIAANRRFATGVAEVETLLEPAARNTEQMRDSLLRLTSQFGGQPEAQAQALYQTISAGITDTTEAMNFLDVANRLAVGGVTDVTTAIDGLTSVINAYGLEASDATDISDQLFTAVRFGKTTAEELAGSIGRVAATANNLSISAGTTFAAIATLTKGGLQTTRAVTGLNQALANIIRPTAEAEQEAARLGIQFDSAALRAQGLQGFLEGITSSESFTEESLERLFTSVEGLNAIVALTAGEMSTFNQALEEMENSSGATQAAFLRMSQTLDFQLTVLTGKFNAFKVRIGEVVEPLIVPLVDAINNLIQAFLDMPAPMQKVVIGIGLATFATLALAGGLALVVGLGVVLAPIFLAVLKIMAIIVLATLPVIAIFLVLGSTLATLVFLIKKNVGGLGDFFDEQFGRIRLAFRALTQLFSDGGFSGEVREEMNRAENQGIRRFVISIFQIGSRIVEFFRGIAAGFSAGLERLGPTLDRFVESMQELGESFGFVSEGADGLADTPMDDFASTGIRLGEFFVDVLDFVVGAITSVVKFWTGFVKVFVTTMKFFGPVFEGLKQAFEELGSAIGELFGGFDKDAKGGVDTATTLGGVFGLVFGVIATVVTASLRGVIRAITFVVNAFNFLKGVGRTLGTFFAGLAIRISTTFMNVVDSIRIAIDTVIAFMGNIVSRIPAALRPEFAGDLIEAGREAEARVATRTTAIGIRTVTTSQLGAIQEAEQQGEVTRAKNQETQIGELTRELRKASQERQRQLRQPIRVNVMVDGEKIAEANASADRRETDRGFVPGVPAETT